MENSNTIKQEFFDSLKKKLNSSSLFEIAEASVSLGESDDPRAIDPLVIKAKTAVDWLVQDFVVGGLTQLAGKLAEASAALKQIVIIEPPESDYILEIKQTAETPHILFDHKKGKFLLRGKGTSDYDNVIAMFKTITNEFESFDKKYPEKPLIASFCFDIIHKELSGHLLYFFQCIAIRRNTIVYWFFNNGDSDMLDAGKDYESVVNLPFRFIEIPQCSDSCFSFV
jgi:hypothetical protein